MLEEVISTPARALRLLSGSEGSNEPLASGDGWSVRTMTEGQDRLAWERFVDAHPLSRAIYPAYSIGAGWKPIPIALLEGDRITGGLELLERRVGALPIGSSRILSVLVGPKDHGAMLEKLLAGVDRLCALHLLVETEVQLRIPANGRIPGFEWWTDIYEAFAGLGYRRLPRADRTYFVRIDRDEVDLLGSFHQKTRNRIRKSWKDRSTVQCYTDAALLEQFYEAYAGTTERKNIRGVLPKATVTEGLRPLFAAGRALLFAEKYEDRIANMVIIDPLGTPCAMLASRTRDNVEGSVPSSAHHMYYAVMRELSKRGHRWFDFGGCEGPVPIESHPNYGVWHFKWMFKGEYVTCMPHLRKIRGARAAQLISLMHKTRGDPVSVE